VITAAPPLSAVAPAQGCPVAVLGLYVMVAPDRWFG
jgi:hypothetical protein